MKFLCLAACCFFLSVSGYAQNQDVTITPLHPAIGETVDISFKSPAVNAQPALVFSYSNFFEMPGTLPMVKEGDRWHTSFTVPRYAKYASFYIKAGDSIYKPSSTSHYELIFYKDGKPVFDTYLYKAYSLSAQMGKSDSLKQKTNALYEKEIALHPDNYAAKLRLLSAKMEQDKPNAAKYKAEALQLINAKLNENPTDMGNVNLVTMGYLIINENTRIDTLKQYLLAKYPTSEVAYEYRYEDAYKTKEEAARIQKMKKLLGYSTDGESSTLSGIHENLFAYYAKLKDEKNALASARIVAGIQNPWQPKEIKTIAEVLAENNLALDTARMYAEKALLMVNDYPFGVIRYFPEYGYIPGYVADKPLMIKQETGNILSLLGNIYTRQGKYTEAERSLKSALTMSQDIEVYKNLAFLYEQTKRPEDAFMAYRKILLQLPTDSAMITDFKRNYVLYSGSEKNYEAEYQSMLSEWDSLTLPKLEKTRINKPAPLLSAVYDMNGKLVDPETLKGKLIVLDFWATWCVPCIEGFPYMQQVFNKFKGRTDVIFMITNSGSKNTLKDAQDWVKRNGFTFPFYYNDRKLAEAFNVNTIPSTFIIDQQGNIQYRTVGFEGPIMEPKLSLEIRSLLKE